jgi:flagellar hook-basal body complex protein FliE
MRTQSINPVIKGNLGSIKQISTVSSNVSFGDVLKEALNKIDNDINTSGSSFNTLVTGNSDGYHKFLLETEKTAMNLQLTLQVRNKAIDAYNEIMRMQL